MNDLNNNNLLLLSASPKSPLPTPLFGRAAEAAIAEGTGLVPKICPMSITMKDECGGRDPAPWVGQTFTVDLPQAIGFLSMLRPTSAWQLVTIDPLQRDLFGFTLPDDKHITRHINGSTFSPNTARAAAFQILGWQRCGCNVYVHVNPFDPEKKRPNKNTGKIQARYRADRQSITSIEFAHADVDPNPNETSPEQVVARVRHRLAELKIEPTFLVQSGRGCHVWLRYTTPLIADGEAGPNTKRAETINKKLCANMGLDVAGADPCWEIARILKIPGCLSFPGSTKKGTPVLPVIL